MKKTVFGVFVVFMVTTLTGCLSMMDTLFGGDNADQSAPVEPDINKVVEVSFDEFKTALESVSSSTLYSFDAYIDDDAWDGGVITVFQEPRKERDPRVWGIPIRYDSEKLPIKGRYKDDQPYKFYVFVQITPGDDWSLLHGRSVRRNLELYRIDGLMTAEEAALAAEAEKKAKEEKEKADAAAKAAARAERIKAIDEQAKPLAKGYTYHGANEDDQNALLFDGGALEDGHAYYISGFMVESGGSLAGVASQTFMGRLGDPKNYHIVEYVNQTVKGKVVNAGQSMFGRLPVTVIVAGGKPPLRIPVVLGLIE